MRTGSNSSGQVAVRAACVAFGVAFLTAIAVGASEGTALVRGAIAALATRLLCPILLMPVHDALRRASGAGKDTAEDAS